MKKTIILDFYNTIYNPDTNDLFPGMLRLLGKMSKNNSLLLITTFSSNRDQAINDLKILPFFKNITYCKRKTTELFKKTIKDPKNTLIIGDRKEEELLIGKTLGIKTIKVDPNKENPTSTIRKALLR